MQEAGCSLQEDLLDGQGLAPASNPGQPTIADTQTDPAMTEGAPQWKLQFPAQLQPEDQMVLMCYIQLLSPSSNAYLRPWTNGRTCRLGLTS